ncbi:hypothetical protein CLOSCI_03393 [[Clostridium] scindens ATCC 35704]|nr:hypothetical protein CLOSCI_03393 [[Clostridium] scindens ATCC 35704]
MEIFKVHSISFSSFLLAGSILIMNNLILEEFIFVLHLPIHPAKFLTECILFLISWFVQNKVIFGQKKMFTFRTAKEVKGYPQENNKNLIFSTHKIQSCMIIYVHLRR